MGKTTSEIDRAGEGPVIEKHHAGSVVTSHPRAARAARDILAEGGHAVEAAVAAALTLGVVDPMSTGVGGDCFAMVWDAAEETMVGLNASGAAPALADAESILSGGSACMPRYGIHSVTVPGALSGFQALHQRWGKLEWSTLFRDAIEAAREGFEVTSVVAADWALEEEALRAGVGTEVFLKEGCAPREGETFHLPELAHTLERLASEGAEFFYEGELAETLEAFAIEQGGSLRRADLVGQQVSWPEPVQVSYRGHPVFQLPPNGQGMIVLQALRLLEDFPLSDLPPLERQHARIEAIKLAFHDMGPQIGDPTVSLEACLARLEEGYVEDLCEEIGGEARCRSLSVAPAGDTVYVATVDRAGNACSLIASVYEHFGARVVVPGTGICLQNRGALFSLEEGSPNRLRPGARPYHTIIPAMAFRMSRPWLVFGVVGGFQQPQGQLQLLTNLIDEGMSLQEAVDAPRFRWVGENRLWLEEGFDEGLQEGLEARGHEIEAPSSPRPFGGAQALGFLADEASWEGASDPRKDGVCLHLEPESSAL